MGYFATPNEYGNSSYPYVLTILSLFILFILTSVLFLNKLDWGGYESELTFWGIKTAEMVKNGCHVITIDLSLFYHPTILSLSLFYIPHLLILIVAYLLFV